MKWKSKQQKMLFHKMFSAHKDFLAARAFLPEYKDNQEGLERLGIAKGKFRRAQQRFLETIE